jgi:hypothetical protein
MAQVMMYKSPGPYAQYGNTMMNLAVEDEQIEMAKAEGWFMSVDEAKKAQADAEANILIPQSPAVDATMPEFVDVDSLSRKELEQAARDHGIEFDGRIGDEKLKRKVAEAAKNEAKE